METEIGGETIARFLDALASGAPTPGGGGAAALQAAIGAALVSMVCHLTLGREKYRAHEATMTAALAEAEQLRAQALALAAEDVAAYGALSAAYGLPRGSDEEKAARSARIQDALKGATDVPLRTMAVAARVVALCVDIAASANPNVISDVGVSALAARAALDAAALNVRINLSTMRDEAFKREAAEQMQRLLDGAHALAGEVLRLVDGGITA